MNLAIIKRPGDDLYRLRVRAVAADQGDIPIPAHQHLVPAEHRVVRQLRVEILVEIDHHLRDAPLRGRHRAVILPKAELATQRGLNAVAVQDFALDFRGLQGLIAYQLDFQRVLVLTPDMPERADKLPGAQQEFSLQRL